MAEPNIHATLHPRHTTRSRQERERIVAEYEPSARDLFAARHLILAGTAHIVVSRHRWARREKLRRWAERWRDAMRDFGWSARRAAESARAYAERTEAAANYARRVA